MLAEFWQKVREMISRLFKGKTIETALNIKPVVSNEMVDAIELWGQMYSGNSPWCREPIKGHPVKIVSMNLAASICSEKARTALIEFKSEITEPLEEIKTDDLNRENPVVAENVEKLKDSSKLSRAEYLNEQFQKKLIKKLRPQLEYGIAKGSLVIKPYVIIDKIKKTDGSEMQKPRMEFEFIQADRFFPISFNGDGDITEAVFVEQKFTNNCKYTRLEHHKIENCKLTITNRAYCNKQNTSNVSELGEEIPLTSISGWSNIQPTVVINYADKLGFGYFKMPTANNIDTHSPLGVSGFSRATKLIREADLQFSRMLWEFEGGTMAIDIDRDALKLYEDSTDPNYTGMSMLQERLYRKLDIGREDTYEVFAPSLRDQAYINGLNNILMRIEDVCEVSRGTIADVSVEARTATELKILRQRSYSSNDDIQKALEKALRDVVYAMDMYCTLYNIVGDAADVENHPETVGQYEISFNWDDSIITDKDSELEKRLLLVNAGISGKVETRMWYFGETEQQAKEALEAIKEEQPEEEPTEDSDDDMKMGVQSFGVKDSQRKMDKPQVDDDITQESQKKLVKPKKD